MKKVTLVIILLVLFAAVAGAAIPKDDKDFSAGLKSYNSKNYTAAVTYFKEYIKRKPHPAAYYLIGYSLYKLGKFSEADEYFKEAYFIDPEFSLEEVGLIRKASGAVVPKEPGLTKKPEPASEKKEGKPISVSAADTKTGQPATSSQLATPDAKAGKPGLTAQTDQKATAPAFPPAPMSKEISAAGPAALIAMVAAFGMILVFIGIAVYVYWSLCLFLIAKKLDVPAPWTAWIPIVQVWTFVVSAGKSGWWVLLFLVPLVNLFIGIYLWICISENLGKNKWLGLLILVPLVGFLYPGWLAFSKTEVSGGYTPPEETLPE